MGASVEPGVVLRGKYRVERMLGEGGMGFVVAAWHMALEQRVAIKFLQPSMLQHPQIVGRFLREARAAARVEGDHVARVVDVDTLEDGTPFMVMEYLEGSDLSWVRAQERPLPVAVAVDYVLQACRAIADAHSLGIVHRDIKPANLFLARRRDGSTRVKVLDFGISKLETDASEANLTKTATAMGSAAYMSPEQMLSARDVDGRTDVWALGVVLYELCTAQVPFPGTTLAQVCALVMSRDPPAPRSFRPEIAPGLEEVILRCLAKDKEQRVQSVAELVALLSPFQRDPGTASTPDGFFPAPNPVTQVVPYVRAGHTSSPSGASAPQPSVAATAVLTPSAPILEQESRAPMQPHPLRGNAQDAAYYPSAGPPAAARSFPSTTAGLTGGTNPAPPTTPWKALAVGAVALVGIGVAVAAFSPGGGLKGGDPAPSQGTELEPKQAMAPAEESPSAALSAEPPDLAPPPTADAPAAASASATAPPAQPKPPVVSPKSTPAKAAPSTPKPAPTAAAPPPPKPSAPVPPVAPAKPKPTLSGGID